jgi:TonB-linked SusC/RagA family outer membrane protein
MRRKLLFAFQLFVFSFLSTLSFAQNNTVTGRVVDQNGNPVAGATVSVQGTTTAAMTNENGTFSLSVPASSKKLVVTSVGFASQDVSINGRTNIPISLAVASSNLSEVVVTALGLERNKKSLQYSVTTVGGENLTQAREISVANALEGRVAGVNVSKIATGPGGSTRVVIRGAKTLGAGNNFNQPLYVVDGVPIDNSNNGQAGLWGGADQGDGMSSINPDDVASITVLKGASAAALYGSRAANGVILVTTKKGTNRKGLGIEVNSNYVLETVQNLTDFQTSYGSGGMVAPPGGTLKDRVATKSASIADAFDNGWSQQAWGPKFDGSQVVQFDGKSRPYSYAGDNWSRFYKKGHTLTNSVALTGGSETQNFRLSVADLRNKGIIPNSGFDRVNIAMSTYSKFAKKLTLNSKVLYSNEKVKNRPNVSDSPGNAVQSIYRLPGDYNVLDLIGDPNKPGAVPSLEQQTAQGISIKDGKAPGEEFQRSTDLWTQNPYWAAYQQINSDTRDRVIASGNLRYDITDFLYVTGQAGMDWYTLRRTQLTPQGTGHNRGGSMSEREDRVREINYEWTAGFNKKFDKIGVNAFVGGNRMRRNENVSANGNGFNTPLFPAINNAKQRDFGYGYNQLGINSLFGSAEVSYNNYLFLTGTARKDWFSVLDPEKNSIVYPSVGASFVFSDALKMPNWLSFGKIRASWAQVGNVNSVGPYTTTLAYTAGSSIIGRPLGSFSSGYSNQSNLPNKDLVPFTSTELEYGAELRFFNNRLGIDVTYYDQKTTDDILNATISRASGFASKSVNLGKITNKGIEVLLTGSPIKGDLTWDVSLNFAKNSSKVVSLIEGQTEFVGEEPRTRNVFIKHIVGYPYGMITGKAQMRDPSGNLVYDSNGVAIAAPGYQILGNGVPDFTGGINNSFTWKGINLTFLIDFKSGGDIFSGTNMRATQQGFTEQTLQGRAGEAPLVVTGVTRDAAGGYKPFTKTLSPGEAQNYWSQLGSEGNGAADKFIYDASFIKLRQITLGYSLPKKVFGGTPIQSVMLSFVARNLAILYKNTPNIDPESTYTSSNSQGLDYYGFPATRNYGLNLRVTF